jgi:hypothetical protein
VGHIRVLEEGEDPEDPPPLREDEQVANAAGASDDDQPHDGNGAH